MFQHLLAKISEASKLAPVSQDKITRMYEQYPAVPKEYIIFLQEVGWGNIGGMMMYHGLLDPNDILAPVDDPWEHVAVFGDDWQGSCFGFDLETGELVEITPAGDVESVELDFQSFIAPYAN